MRQDKGFTILELLIVLFLTVLILGLSVLFFANFLTSHKFNATVRDISTTIKQARALAQIHGERQTFTIDLDTKKYWIEGHEAKDIPSDIKIMIKDPMFGEIREGKYNFILHEIGVEGGEIVLSSNKKSASIQLDPVIGSMVIK